METDPFLVNLLEAGLAHCRAVIDSDGGLMLSLFLAGLIGSLGHCVGMCGPFVLSQTVARLEARPAATMREFHRLTGAALVPYHLGRSTTYAGLGALAAAVAGGLIEATGLHGLSTGLLILAAFFFLGYALQRLGWPLPWLSRGGGWWSRTVGRRARVLFDRPVGWRGYALGVALGFIPCGLLYGALAAAAGSGSALAGALAMIAFALGTVPALFAVALAGHVVGERWRGTLGRATAALMLVNAAQLTYLAWRTVT